MVVTAVALVGIIAPVLYLTWHSIASESHTPAALRSVGDALPSGEADRGLAGDDD